MEQNKLSWFIAGVKNMKNSGVFLPVMWKLLLKCHVLLISHYWLLPFGCKLQNDFMNLAACYFQISFCVTFIGRGPPLIYGRACIWQGCTNKESLQLERYWPQKHNNMMSDIWGKLGSNVQSRKPQQTMLLTVMDIIQIYLVKAPGQHKSFPNLMFIFVKVIIWYRMVMCYLTWQHNIYKKQCAYY